MTSSPDLLLARFRSEADRVFPGLVAGASIADIDGPGDRTFRIDFADGTHATRIVAGHTVEVNGLDVASDVAETMWGLIATARHLQVHGW